MVSNSAFSAEFKELTDTRDFLAETAELFRAVKHNALPKTALPAEAWPRFAKVAQPAHGAAHQSIDEASQAMAETSEAMVGALSQVIGAYDTAGQMSTIGRPYRFASSLTADLTAPKPGGPLTWTGTTGSYIAGAAGAGATGMGGALLKGTAEASLKAAATASRIRLMAAAARMGIAFGTFAALDALLVMPNLRDPEPFFAASDNWALIEKKMTDVFLRHNPPENWTGEAAEAFHKYMEDTYLHALMQFRHLAHEMKEACMSIGEALSHYLDFQKNLLILAAASLTMISFIVATSPLLTVIAGGMTAGFLISFLRDLEKKVEPVKNGIDTLTSDANTLTAECIDKGKTLEYERVRLWAKFTSEVTNVSGSMRDLWHPKQP